VAVLERINFMKMDRDPSGEWIHDSSKKTLKGLPQIFFDNGEPWAAANLYAFSKLNISIKTVLSNMSHLKAYASWLEAKQLDWRHFPNKKRDRCLFRYRGNLIDQRTTGAISPSTTTNRMNAIIHFYRWAKANGHIERQKLWEDRTKAVRFYTTAGFARTLAVLSSELSIPNRKCNSTNLEDGLIPLTLANRDILLHFLDDHGMKELYMMMLVGFYTGARSETIRTLRLSSLENTVDDPLTSEIKRIPVGPPTKVKTKFNVSGSLLMPKPLLHQLEIYSTDIRRLTRQAKSSRENTTLLFLTNRGNPYSDTSFTKLLSRLRYQLKDAGYSQFDDFKFHQTRATYGTHLMKFAMDELPNQTDAIVFVRDAMLHKNEATTWKYIKFIENQPIKEKLADEFFNVYTGKPVDAQNLIKKVVLDD